MELEVEEEDGGRGQDDQGREGGAERHPQQEVVGGAAGGPEGLQGRYSVLVRAKPRIFQKGLLCSVTISLNKSSPGLG